MLKTLRKFVFLFVLVFALVCSVAFVACKKTDDDTPDDTQITNPTPDGDKTPDDGESNKNEQPKAETRSIALTVKMPTGFTLPSDVKVQVTDASGNVKVAAKAVSSAVTVLKEDCFVELVNLPAYLTAEKVEVKAKDFRTTINVSAKAIDYTVTVDAEAGISLDGVTVTFYKGGNPVEGATELALNGNSVTANLMADAYTADINGLVGPYEWTAAGLTYTAPSATITVTAVKYTVNVDLNAPNLAELTVTTVTLSDGNNQYYGTLENGKAVIEAPKGEYTVDLGLGGSYGLTYEPLTETNKETTVIVAEVLNGGKYWYRDSRNDPYSGGSGLNVLNKEGRFIVTANVQTVGGLTQITAPAMQIKHWGADPSNTYNVTWTDANVSYFEVEQGNTGFKGTGSGYVRFVLGATNNAVEFALAYERTAPQIGETFKFIVEIAQSEGPKAGSMDNPFILASGKIVGDHDEAADLEEAYFLFERQGINNDKRSWYQISFPENNFSDYTVVFYETGNYSFGQVLSEEANFFQNYFIDSDNAYQSVLYIKSNNGSPIVFKLETYDANVNAAGSSRENAIEIELGEYIDNPPHFYSNSDPSRWYVFAPVKTGYYLVDDENTFEYGKLYIYKDEETSALAVMEFSGDKLIELEAGHTYYFELKAANLASTSDAGYDVGFKLSEFAAVPGTLKDDPKQLVAGTNVADVAGKVVYFYYEAAVAGTFDISFVRASGIAVNIYSNADFSSGALKTGLYTTETWSRAMAAGEKIYLFLNTENAFGVVSVTMNVSFKSAGDEAQTEYDLTLGTTLADVKLTSTVNEITLNLKGVVAGTYELAYELDKTTTASIKFEAEGSVVTVSGKSGFGTIEIQQGVTAIIIKVENLTSTIFVNVTLSVPDGIVAGTPYKAKLDGSGNMYNEYNETFKFLNVPAGDYTLTLDGPASLGGPPLTAYLGTKAITNGTTLKGTFDVTITSSITGIRFNCPQWIWGSAFNVTITLTPKTPVQPDPDVPDVPAAGLGVGEDNAYALTLSFTNYDYANVEIPLKDVDAGTYTIAVTPATAVSTADLAFVVNGKEYKSASFKEVVIPANCKSITAKYYLWDTTIDITITLTLNEESGENPDPDPNPNPDPEPEPGDTVVKPVPGGAGAVAEISEVKSGDVIIVDMSESDMAATARKVYFNFIKTADLTKFKIKVVIEYCLADGEWIAGTTATKTSTVSSNTNYAQASFTPQANYTQFKITFETVQTNTSGTTYEDATLSFELELFR